MGARINRRWRRAESALCGGEGWPIGRASRPIGKEQRLALAEQGFAKEAVVGLGAIAA
jgi:hypothetical protein